MANIEGLGGVFIASKDARALADWYGDVLGIEMKPMPDGTSFYKVFFSRDVHTSQLRENPVFAIVPAEKDIQKGVDHFTLNLRVDNLEPFLAQIRSHGVKTEGEKLVWERGLLHWIRDLDGNRIELYEEILVDTDKFTSFVKTYPIRLIVHFENL